MTDEIVVRHLAKHFRTRDHGDGSMLAELLRPRLTTKIAVRDVSFTVRKGEMVAYLGPNGAGKSTTVKCLSGILAPTSGEVRVCGLDPVRQRVDLVRRIGVVFGQKTSLWWDVPVVDTYQLLRRVYDIPDSAFRTRLAVLRKTLELAEFERTPVRQLSLGQRMRADLGAALLHSPTVLFLDEPTIGLDVVAKENLHTFVRQMNEAEGVTVVLTTHDMRDVEALCGRIMIIDDGRLIFDGTPREITERWTPWTEIILDLDHSVAPLALDGIEEISRTPHQCTVRFLRAQHPLTHVVAVLTRHYPVVDFQVREPTIEAVIKNIYQPLRA